MGHLNSADGIQADGSPVTGGGLSQNGKFSYGYASSPGKRSSMEDFYETRIDGVDGELVGLFGVFDGHGGVRAAEYVKEHLFSNLIRHPKFISDTKSAIADAYSHTDSEFLKSESTQNRDAGSTASTAILVGDRLLVANVGDSRAVICRGGKAFAVSRDHKPDQTDERQRIEDAGGFVIWAGTWRVGGVLAVSRAFGDRLLKQFVVADPEIQEEVIDNSLEFLILASDGLWDVVTNEEAVAMIQSIEDAEQAAKRLLQEAYQRGSADNITCVVVRFFSGRGNNATVQIQGNTPTMQNQGNLATLQNQGNTATVQNQGNTATVQNQGNTSTVQKQGNLATLQNQGNAATVQNQGNTSTVQKQGNLATLQNRGNTATVQNLGNMPTVQNQGNTATVENQGNTATVQNRGNTATVQNRGNTATVQNRGNTATVQNRGNTATLQNRGNTATLQNQENTATVQNRGNTATLQNQENTATLQNQENTATVQNRGNTATVQNGL